METECEDPFGPKSLRRILRYLYEPSELAEHSLVRSDLVTRELQRNRQENRLETRVAAFKDLVEAFLDEQKLSSHPGKERRARYCELLQQTYLEESSREQAAERLGLRPSTYDRHHNKALIWLGEELRQKNRAAAEQLAQRPQLGVPNNVPFPEYEFVPRDALVRRVEQALAKREGNPIVVLWGPPGVGNTAIAIHVASHHIYSDQFKAVIWVDGQPQRLAANGNGVPRYSLLTIDRMYDIIGQITGRSVLRASLDEKRDRVTEILRQGRYLIVIDNFQTIEDPHLFLSFLTNPFLFPSHNRVIITSQRRLETTALHIPVDGMQWPEALRFMRVVAAELETQEILQAPDEALRTIYEYTDGYPIALQCAIGQAKMGRTLEDIVSWLCDRRQPVPPKLEEYFARSYTLLQEPAREMLHALSFFATSASREAAGAVTGLGPGEVDEGVAQLRDLNFIARPKDGRLAVRQLARAFVSERLWQENPTSERRLFSDAIRYYKEFCREHERDLQSMDAERENVLAIIDRCLEEKRWDEAVALTKSISAYLHDAGYWQFYVDYSYKAMVASTSASDLRSQVDFMVMNIAFLHYQRSELQAGMAIAEEGLRLARGAQYAKGEAMALRVLGMLWRRMGDLGKAKSMLAESERLLSALGDEEWAHRVRGSYASVLRESDRVNDAQDILEKELTYFEQYNDPIGICKTISRLGSVAHKNGKLNQATKLFERAIELDVQLGRKAGEAHDRKRLAAVKKEQGLWREVVEQAEKAHAIFQEEGALAEAREALSLLEEARSMCASPESYQRARELVERASTVVILTHKDPDVDAISSVLALTMALEMKGKKVIPVTEPVESPLYRSLPRSEKLRISSTCAESWATALAPSPSLLLVTVDTASLDQVGGVSANDQQFFADRSILNIDHHITNTRFGKVNVVEPQAGSTTQVLFDLMPTMDLPLDRDIAFCLLVGIVVDTARFTTTNTTQYTMEAVGRLLSQGIDMSQVMALVQTRDSVTKAELWGNALSKIHTSAHGRVAWSSVSRAAVEEAGAAQEDLAGLADYLRSLAGVQVAVAFIEQEDGSTKVSLRSRPRVNVASVAERFGGGGHMEGAGCTLGADGRDQAMQQLISEVEKLVQDLPASL